MKPDETCVKMVQMSRYGWQIVSPKGFVLKDCIYLDNIDKAEEFIKNYISSFLNWTYEIKKLEE